VPDELTIATHQHYEEQLEAHGLLIVTVTVDGDCTR
jgi:hypothetical protein